MRGMPVVRLVLGGAIVCLAIAGCGGGATPTPGSTPVPSPSTASPTERPSNAQVELPTVPTAFSAAYGEDLVKCPGEPDDPDDEWMCHVVKLEWQSTNGPQTQFRVYHAWTGEGDPMPTCADITSDEITQLMDSAAGARTADHYQHVGATGGGQECYWLSAFNAAGESKLVPAAAN